MMSRLNRRAGTAVLLIVATALMAALMTTHGFTPAAPSSSSSRQPAATTRTASSREIIGTKLYSEKRPIKDISFGEESRKFRRTVFSHDDWKVFRSPDRFFYYLLTIPTSGVYRNLSREVTFTTAIAVFVWFYNIVVGGYTDLGGVEHAALISSPYLLKMGLPLTPFTLASPSLGLLLVFRTNTSYRRWDEARKNWGMNINHTRDLVRMANTYYDSTGVSPEEREKDLNHVALCTWAFVRAMKRHLSPTEEDELDFQAELKAKLPKEQANKIIDAAHRPNRALQDLSYAIDNLPMHFVRKNEIHMAVTIFEDNLGSSERLLTSPVPLVYSRHTARFLYTWLLFVPFALYEPFAFSWNHIAMIPAMLVLSVFLFGIEELATQLEEPFTILPMQAFCDKIYNWCMEIMSWSPGDNGYQMKQVKPEHKYFVSSAPSHSSPPQYVPQMQQQPAPSAYSYEDQQIQTPPPPYQQQQPPAAPQQQSMDDFLRSQGVQ